MEIRVGIDFGGVIVKNKQRKQGADTQLKQGDSMNAAQDGVIEAVRELVSLSDGHVWIVSKAGPRMQAITRRWLESTSFFDATGLPPENLRFCLERQEKENICRKLGVTHFIDDRIHIMQILRAAVPNLYLFGEVGGNAFAPPWTTYVTSWPQLIDIVTESARRE